MFWLFNWIRSWFSKSQVQALPACEPSDIAERLQEFDSLLGIMPNNNFNFLAILKQEATAQYQKEMSIFTDENLCKYCRNVFRHMIYDYINSPSKLSHDFVLIGPGDIGIPGECYNSFYKIFQIFCEEIGLPVYQGLRYMKIYYKDIKNLLAKIDAPQLDPTERASAIKNKLSIGILS
jgi:hypothetical protein